jgi:hypothetical protein
MLETSSHRQYARTGQRSFAHLYETGGMRRVHLRGRNNILKRLLVHGAAFNLSLFLRKNLGVGKPRRLQGLSLQFLPLFARLFQWFGLFSRTQGPEPGSFVSQRPLYRSDIAAGSGRFQVTCYRLAATRRGSSFDKAELPFPRE